MAQLSVLNSVFDTIQGLPVHPLAVHLAVVLVPLGALSLVALAFLPKLQKTYLPIVIGVLGIGTIATFVAKESGEQLAQRVGLPTEHAELGDILFPASVGLLLLSIAMLVFSKLNKTGWQKNVLIGAASVAAISVSGLTYFVGHTGAEATWASRIQIVQPADSKPDASGTSSDNSSPTSSESGSAEGISWTEVSAHSSADDCWSVVEGQVLDLTSYIDKHPGGAQVISQICGKDGTQAFAGQHSGQSTPMNQLQALVIGTLASTEPAPSASDSESGADTATGAFTATEVAKHNKASDCWSVVNGNVYDLTGYVTSHPGGSSAIAGLCGLDASGAFGSQHGTATRPVSALTAFQIGALAAGATVTPADVGTGYGDENEESDEEGDDD